MKKGYFGYLNRKRKTAAAIAVLLVAMVMIVYFGALRHFGTNKNVFSLLAALMCLPAGKAVVDVVMYVRAKGCSDAASALIEMRTADLTAAYDLYLTSYNKNYQISHLAIANKSICALTESDSCDCREGEAHIRKMLQDNGFQDYTVKIFRDRSKYLDRLDEMNRTAGGKKHKRDEEVLQLFYQISI